MKRLCALVLPLLLLGAAGSADRVFTVRDSIEMVHFLPDPNDGYCANPKVVFSPDNRYFAFVTSRGIIRSNAIASTISVFSTVAVQNYLRGGKAVQPRIIAHVTAVPRTDDDCSYEPVIFTLQWLPNSHGVLFTAEGAAANERRLYEADLALGSMHALSPQGYDVKEFVTAGNSIVYEATPPRMAHPVGKRINPDAIDVTGERLFSVLFSQFAAAQIQGPDSGNPNTLWVVRNGMNRRITGNSAHPLQLVDAVDDVFSVSPTGDAVITLLPVKQIPPSWATFEPDPRVPYFRLKPGDLAATAPSQRPRTYTLVDLITGKIHPLIQAPNGYALGSGHREGAAWSPSERKLLVMNTFLPLEGIDAAERAQRRYPCIAAVVDVHTLETQCLAFDAYAYDVKGPLLLNGSFGRSDDDVVLHVLELPDQTYTDEQYHFENGAWRLVQSKVSTATGSPPPTGSLSIAIRQSPNLPPALWAADLHRGITKKLWDPNPQLAHMQLGEESILRWKDSSGYAWVAGLVKPPGYVRGKRYPLVIQTHGFYQPNDFMTDGVYTTAFAARELAGAGMMVLQMPMNAEHSGSSQEVPDQIRGFQSAIARLDAMGLIDPKRVGAIGFSRTCYYVEGALIADPHLFAAASITDGVDESYIQYMLYGVDNPSFAPEFEHLYGTPPFGSGLATWVKTAPGFQLNRARTPLLIGAVEGPGSILFEWEIYASLRMQKKPVDMLYIPNGQHILQKPLDRLASQQSNVDWFRFWLQGYEDPDHAKVAQYKRWEVLRKLQQ